MENLKSENKDYIVRAIKSGDINRAVCDLTFWGYSYIDAKKVVFEEMNRLNGTSDSMPKYWGYCENSEIPVKPGTVITIKKGTKILRDGKVSEVRKTYRVRVDHILPGSLSYVQHATEVSPTRNPRVVWAGTGGLWTSVDINDVPEA